MKKLYRRGTVHPSPSPSSTSTSTSLHFPSLSFLPAAILSLSAALSADDLQVLAYLLSSSTTTPFDFQPSKSFSSHKKHNNKKHPCNNNNNNTTHVTCFTCYCFSCYTSYWARWDSSPNRQLIHDIIDAFEDDLLAQMQKKKEVNRRVKRKNVNNKSFDYGVNDKSKGLVRVNPDSCRVGSVEDGGGAGQLGDETGERQGSVRKMVSFIWETVWG